MKVIKFKYNTLYFKAFATLLLFTVFLSNCEKENLNTETTLEQELNQDIHFRNTGDGDVDYSVAENILAAINYDEILTNDDLGALDFPSAANLSNTLSLLEEANQALADEISSSLMGLSDDEIEFMDINEDYAFESFENNFPNFNSLRAMIADLEEAFFDNEELNDDEDPTDTHDAIPVVLRVVMNTYGEVVFQGEDVPVSQIHISRPDGGNYTITNGDIETALQIRAGLSHDQIAMKNAVNFEDIPNDDGASGGSGGGAIEQCDPSRIKTVTKYHPPGGTYSYRAKLKVGIRNSSLWKIHRAYSELKSHRKKNNGRWKKYTTTISINQAGYGYTDMDGVECGGDGLNATISGNKRDWKYRIEKDFPEKVSASNKGGFPSTLQATFHWLGQTYNLRIF